MTEIVVPQVRALDVRLDGSDVVVLSEGRLALRVPAGEVADALARAIVIQSRKGEEIAKAESIAFDQAILLRAGVPVGLTSHPKVQEEAAKEAAWNRDLRRYMPGGVKSQEQFGTPAIRKEAHR